MRVTRDFAISCFTRFNDLLFDSRLPLIPIEINSSRKAMGMFVFPTICPGPHSNHVSRCRLKISNRFDLPSNQLEDIIIHEMIHYYLWVTDVSDNAPHGYAFRKIMNRINRTHGRAISVSHRLTSKTQATDTRKTNNYIIVVQWNDGRLNMAKVTRSFIFEMHRICNMLPDVKKCSWYWSTNSWFNRFPAVRSAKLYNLSQDDFRLYFSDAISCRCDGRIFQPARD